MYLVTGNFFVKQTERDRAESIMREIEQVGRTEEGIVRYKFFQVPDNSNRYFLFEEWQNKDLHDQHFNSKFMQDTVPGLFACLAEDPQVTYYDAEVESTL